MLFRSNSAAAYVKYSVPNSYFKYPRTFENEVGMDSPSRRSRTVNFGVKCRTLRLIFQVSNVLIQVARTTKASAPTAMLRVITGPVNMSQICREVGDTAAFSTYSCTIHQKSTTGENSSRRLTAQGLHGIARSSP